MLKIKLEHGSLFRQDLSYVLKLTVYQSDTKQFCDVIFSTPYLNKLSEEDLNNLCEQLQHSFITCSENLSGLANNGCAYDPEIAKLIKKDLE